MAAKLSKTIGSRSDACAPPRKRRSLEWVREVLGRQIRLELGRKQLPQRTAGEKKRDDKRDTKREDDEAVTLSLVMQQIAEIGARLLIHDPSTQPVRHLFILHDELRRGGWQQVEKLPPKVIDRALTEAEILEDSEPSPLLTTIVSELRELKAAAGERCEHLLGLGDSRIVDRDRDALDALVREVRRGIAAVEQAAAGQREARVQDAVGELLGDLRRHRRVGAAHQDLELAVQGLLVEAHRFGALAVEAQVGDRLGHVDSRR